MKQRKKRATQIVTLILLSGSINSCTSQQQVAETASAKKESKFDSILKHKYQNLHNINQGNNLVFNVGSNLKSTKKNTAKINTIDSTTIRGGFGTTGISQSSAS